MLLDLLSLTYFVRILIQQSLAIPYTNHKVMSLYKNAVSRRTDTKGVLVLDISSPFVNAYGNVKEKATAVQRKILNDTGVDILVS